MMSNDSGWFVSSGSVLVCCTASHHTALLLPLRPHPTPPRPFLDPRSLLAPIQPGDRPLCVLNTHLFFHYMAPHIRTMHVWAMVQASAVPCWLLLLGLLRAGGMRAGEPSWHVSVRMGAVPA